MTLAYHIAPADGRSRSMRRCVDAAFPLVWLSIELLLLLLQKPSIRPASPNRCACPIQPARCCRFIAAHATNPGSARGLPERTLDGIRATASAGAGSFSGAPSAFAGTYPSLVPSAFTGAPPSLISSAFYWKAPISGALRLRRHNTHVSILRYLCVVQHVQATNSQGVDKQTGRQAVEREAIVTLAKPALCILPFLPFLIVLPSIPSNPPPLLLLCSFSSLSSFSSSSSSSSSSS
ncbi:hypothetical protein BZA05DRAFT_249058 [Tricharina praecox]|uniref:uncharacterized protein n=1 Tax=Tricharina praecox TaxID=43433 RepID=UPI0022209BC7|nr:uncharacterized protein BZA05DRAFT_249058 [Tricharina praecox]KAI5854757.1 hypothetical protein BZA05DRAFT_249058 [Tricharina praecox]